MSGYQLSSVMPQPKPRNMRRLGGVTGAAADANRRKPRESRKGSAMVAVLERRNRRRFSDGFISILFVVCKGLLGVKFFTLDQVVDELSHPPIFRLSLLQQIVNKRLVAETTGAAQPIFDQSTAETARKFV
jgi:hypothetical protein